MVPIAAWFVFAGEPRRYILDNKKDANFR